MVGFVMALFHVDTNYICKAAMYLRNERCFVVECTLNAQTRRSTGDDIIGDGHLESSWIVPLHIVVRLQVLAN